MDKCSTYLSLTEDFSLSSLLTFYELALSRSAPDGNTTCRFDWWTFVFVDQTKTFFGGTRVALGEMRVAAVPTLNLTISHSLDSVEDRPAESSPPPPRDSQQDRLTSLTSPFWEPLGFTG